MDSDWKIMDIVGSYTYGDDKKAEQLTDELNDLVTLVKEETIDKHAIIRRRIVTVIDHVFTGVIHLLVKVMLPIIIGVTALLAVFQLNFGCENYSIQEYAEGNIPARCSGWLEGE